MKNISIDLKIELLELEIKKINAEIEELKLTKSFNPNGMSLAMSDNKIKPLNQKIYSVNNKLRESEIPKPKDAILDALKHLLAPIDEDNISKKEKQRLEVNNLSVQRAIKARIKQLKLIK